MFRITTVGGTGVQWADIRDSSRTKPLTKPVSHALQELADSKTAITVLWSSGQDLWEKSEFCRMM